VAAHRSVPPPGAVARLIAFGTPIVDAAAYIRYARPGIQAAAEPGAKVFAFEAIGNVCRSNNLLLDAAGERDDLEALVLVDEQVQLDDPELCAKLRAAFQDPGVAVAGWMGATGVRTIAWWEGRISCGPVLQQFNEHGGGRQPACSWTDVGEPPAEVDTVDGRLMALSPWAVRNLRFDEGLSLGFGYDLDYCLQARAAGRKVLTASIRAIHHHSLKLVPDEKLWVEGHIHVAEKWDGRMPGEPARETDWKARARRAEAEREVARTMAYSARVRADARVQPLEDELEAMTGSSAWRATAPLRTLNRLRRRRRT
jgi:Glycosyltransferase like family